MAHHPAAFGRTSGGSPERTSPDARPGRLARRLCRVLPVLLLLVGIGGAGGSPAAASTVPMASPAVTLVAQVGAGVVADGGVVTEGPAVAESDGVAAVGGAEALRPAAAPDAFAAAVAALARGGFAERQAAIGSLARLGDGRAVAVLAALADGLLFVRPGSPADGGPADGGPGDAVVIGAMAGDEVVAVDAVTGVDAGRLSMAELEKISVNNRLRGVIRDALSGLRVVSPDPSARLEAVRAMLKSPAAGTAPLLASALSRETDTGVREAMQLALAAAELAGTDPARRLAAIGTLAQHPGPDVRGLLAPLIVVGADGTPMESDAAVRAAADAALHDIERHLALVGVVETLFHGVSLGSVLLLAAIGLAVTFGVMGVINMAHGEMIMLGAYTAFVVQEAFHAFLPPGVFGLSLPLAVPAAFVVAGVVGIVIERTVIRWLYGRPLETLLATWGVSLVLQQLVRSLFGATNRRVENPDWMSGGIEVLGGLTLTWNRLAIIVFCLVVLGLLAATLRRTAFGLHMRAVTQNRSMAAAMGIPTHRVDALTFGLGSGIAGIAGVALSQVTNVSPNLGQDYIVDSFMVVVFGGVGSLWGTLVGALSLGVVNKVLEPYAGAMLGKILVLVFIILFIQKRPRGLFALKGRSVEG